MRYNKLKLLLVLPLWLLSSFAFAKAAFDVAPVHVYVDLSRPQTVVYLVKNTGDELIHIRIHPEYIPLDSEQYHVGKTLLTPEEDAKTNLSPYIIVSPQVISLEPSQQRQVRVSVHVPSNLPDGSYRAHMVFHMMEVAQKFTSTTKNANGKAVGINLGMLLQIATAIYADKGKPGAVNPEIKCAIDEKNKTLQLEITNTTVWNVPLALTGESKDQKEKFFDINGEVFRNSITRVNTPWKPKGQHTILIHFSSVTHQASGQTLCVV